MSRTALTISSTHAEALRELRGRGQIGFGLQQRAQVPSCGVGISPSRTQQRQGEQGPRPTGAVVDPSAQPRAEVPDEGGQQPTGQRHGEGDRRAAAERGQPTEEPANKAFYAVANAPKQLWEVPGSGHIGGTEAQPLEYERRIVAFFDRTLLGDA